MTLIDPAYPSGRSFRPAKGEVETRIGPLGLNAQRLPDQAAIDRLYEERDFQRACQAYLWALPIVACGQWRNQHETVFGARDGDIVKYVSVRDKLGLITANATTPYVIGFVNTARTGPVGAMSLGLAEPVDGSRSAERSMTPMMSASDTFSGGLTR